MIFEEGQLVYVCGISGEWEPGRYVRYEAIPNMHVVRVGAGSIALGLRFSLDRVRTAEEQALAVLAQ